VQTIANEMNMILLLSSNMGKGKLMWPFSAQRRQISTPRQLALPTNT